MNFTVTVQGTAYKDITAESVMAALTQVIADRDAGLIAGYNNAQPADIKITKV
jgi:hypothetical protein